MMQWIKNISTGMNVLTIIFGAVTGVAAMFVALNRLRKWYSKLRKLRKEKDPFKQEQRLIVTEKQKSTPTEVREKPKNFFETIPKSKKDLIYFARQARVRIEWLDDQLKHSQKSCTGLSNQNRRLSKSLDDTRRERDKLQAHLEDTYRTIGQAYEQSDPTMSHAPTSKEIERAVRCLTKGAKKLNAPWPEPRLMKRWPIDAHTMTTTARHDIDFTGLMKFVFPHGDVRSGGPKYEYRTPSGTSYKFRGEGHMSRYMKAVRKQCDLDHKMGNLPDPTTWDYVNAMHYCIDHDTITRDVKGNLMGRA